MSKLSRRYSYLKYPFSRSGWYCLSVGLLALVLTAAVVITATLDSAAVSKFAASVGFSAMAADICGIVFLIKALREKQKNHIFTLIGGLMLVGVLALWVYILL